MAAPRIESQVLNVTLHSDRERRAVDRETTCPILVRTFVHVGRHFSASELTRGEFPSDDSLVPIHTWMDASLKEITNTIRERFPDARRLGTRLSFRLLSPAEKAGYLTRPVGEIHVGNPKGADKTLDDMHLQIGDILDVCVHLRGGGGAGGPMRGRDERLRDRNRDRGRENYRDRERENRRQR